MSEGTGERIAADAVPESYPAALRDHGVLVPGGPGLFGWGEGLERVYLGLERMLTRIGREAGIRVLRFPPLLRREVFERSEFAHSFPQLFGSVHAFTGGDRSHAQLLDAMSSGADWSAGTRQTDFVLTPAACYPVYPLYGDRQLGDDVTVDVSSYCFRHEPSTEPGRLVTFRQREFVRIGAPDAVEEWLARWQVRAVDAIRTLGLDGKLENAADPFFGRGAKLLASSQREQNLKVEIISAIGEHPVAIASCNNHRDHFGRAFGIGTADGMPAHTACIGFGQERIAFALVAAHGPDPDRWPARLHEVLWA